MGWFSGRDDPAPAPDPAQTLDVASDEVELVIPRLLPIDPPGTARVEAAVAQLSADGVDLDDLASLAAAYDRAYAEWAAARRSKRESHDALIERFGLGIAEHLARTTDLEWGRVSDAFGTEIGVGSRTDGELLVPTNLVSVRWMQGDTGWVVPVVSGIIRRRAGRAGR